VLSCYTLVMSENPLEPSEIKRKPTPRPEFKEPTHIKRDNMVLHTWGDSTSGFVTDRVISSTKQLHVLEFELGPSSGFRHSSINQTIFAADILYFVLEGDLILANPKTGEVEKPGITALAWGKKLLVSLSTFPLPQQWGLLLNSQRDSHPC